MATFEPEEFKKIMETLLETDPLWYQFILDFLNEEVTREEVEVFCNWSDDERKAYLNKRYGSRDNMTMNLKKISDKLEEISDMLDDLRELTSNSILSDGMANISAEFNQLALQVDDEGMRRQELAEVADAERLLIENVRSVFAVYDMNENKIAELLSRPKKAPFLLILKHKMELNGYDFSKQTLKDEVVAKYAVNAIYADLSAFASGKPSIMQSFLNEN